MGTRCRSYRLRKRKDIMKERINYLKDEAVRTNERRKKRQITAGAIITAFFGFGVVGGIADYEGLREGISMYAVFLIPGIVLLLSGFNIGRMIDAARRYNGIFSADRDGVVTCDELGGQLGMDENRIFKELEVLFRKGFFQNCTLQRGGSPCVIISDAMIGEDGVGFISAMCPACGAVTRIRAGSRGKCSYCGAPISDTESRE